MYFWSVFIVQFVLQGVHEVNTLSVGTEVYVCVCEYELCIFNAVKRFTNDDQMVLFFRH